MNGVDVIEVGKQFGDVVVLDRISLHVAGGEAVALFGPSGCGKTTLLRIIAGLESPDEGSIRLRGKEVSGRGIFVQPNERRIGMVFQDLALWPHMTAERHLGFVLRGKGYSPTDCSNRVRELIELLGLSHRLRAYPNQMSGGEQQRLAIARALVTDPDVVLLDEPFANLDEELKERIIGEIRRRKTDYGVSVLIATHDKGDLDSLADRIVLMERR